jgi:beta-mannosidase
VLDLARIAEVAQLRGARQYLSAGWEIAASAPDAVAAPDDSAFGGLSWLPASAAGTVASILRAAGTWSFLSGRRFDAEDWWYRLRWVPAESLVGPNRVSLGFDGLATVADAWLNGKHLLSSGNMFVGHVVDDVALPSGENELVLRFRALDTLLQARRARPRWRAPMVENQQLRWFRTTLLGRVPGWSPPVAPVGPWRPIWLQGSDVVSIAEPRVNTRVQGSTGVVRASLRINAPAGMQPPRVRLIVSRGGREFGAELSSASGGADFRGDVLVDPVDLWWPHTHGEPALYQLRVEVHTDHGQQPAITVGLGTIGFRTVAVDLAEGNFALHINGERVFCRGACWTPPDVVKLDTDASAAENAIRQLTAAGMNMVRVGGTMVYESDAFLDVCDEQGVLVWQDFMFANMDYPESDAAFDASVRAECTQQLTRLSGRPCLAVLCGNSEGEQQAAMWGAPRERWSHRLFAELLPRLAAEFVPDVPYWPSSAHGGAFPHQANSGTTSYYGVGAYLRPFSDARLAEIRFASECLALANVPEEEMLSQLSGGGSIKVHSPLWKSRVPRDLGAGWDFDDVRDHYFRTLFGVDPIQVRYAEHDRYLDMSRIVSLEVMTATFREWRRGRSGCNGALIWFLRDLWPGAGWGVIDASGAPKSAYFGLGRLLQPRTVFLTDEGLSGLCAHIVNETATPLDAVLEVTLVPPGSGAATQHRQSVAVAPRRCVEIPVASLLGGFSDLTYAYRFGPPPYEAVVASLIQADEALSHDFYFPLGHAHLSSADLGLSAQASSVSDNTAVLEVCSQRLARFVTIRVPGFRAEEQYFHLAPGMRRRIRLHSIQGCSELMGKVFAFNGRSPAPITVQPAARSP